MRHRWAVVVALVLLTGSAAVRLHRAEAQGPAEQGKRVFIEQGCHGCHTVQSQKLGTPIGPDLSHVGAKYSETYLRDWLRDPAHQRPAAHMPKLELTDPQIATLAAFLASLR